MGSNGPQQGQPLNLGAVPNLGALGKGQVKAGQPAMLMEHEILFEDGSLEVFVIDGFMVDQTGTLSLGVGGKLVMSLARGEWRSIRRSDFQPVDV